MIANLRFLAVAFFLSAFASVQSASTLERREVCVCPGSITRGPCDFGVVSPTECETID
ncbi:hypothetical protein SISSUDRAFT_1042245 [Sistotremastrum suecicum HHB10207 ss-3]|uniref:Uncharacterized protein n=1 Tax=Sistotremastrum suecicum HHB10207 ss-3 TaxID=1314776 RepID=A0A166GT45_9AGAM|nr:hypothetical protein SISSUDRAFT_1042245 [Sistotremastrum suecicum HHB10207 ss-3]